jgi:hypothetical protein
MPVIAGERQSAFSSKANLNPVVPQTPQGVNTENKYMSGGFLSKLGDVLQTPQYALTGFLSGKGVKEGIEKKITPSKALNIANPALGFAADLVLDPLNLAFGLGALSKGAKIAGAVSTADKLSKAADLGVTGLVKSGVEKVTEPVIAKLEPGVREALGAKKLTGAEKVRAEQIEKGSISVGEKEAAIRESAKPTSELLSDALDKFPVFGKVKTIAEELGTRTPKSFLGRRSTMETAIAKGAEFAKETGEFLTKGLSPGQQQRIGQIMKGGISIGDTEAPLRLIAGLGRRRIDSLSSELVNELKTGGFGAGKEDLIGKVLNNVGQYMPRMYREFVEDPKKFVDFIAGGKSARIINEFLKKRKDIPEDVRMAMGEILEPGFPVAKRMQQMTHSIEVSKFFRWVNKNFADTQNRTGDLVKLSDNANLGILRNKFVPKEIYNQINDIGKVGRIGENAMTKAIDAYKKALGLWKYGKIVLNPATQARNFMSNLILMDLGHFPLFRPEGLKIFSEAIREYSTKGEAYQLARKTGLMGTDYFRNEIQPFLNSWDNVKSENLLGKGLESFKKGAILPGKAYTATEEVSKLAMFMWRMSKGDKAKTASDYAKKWLFDYRDVPAFIQYLRNAPFGFPFITFVTKAAPRIAETVAKEPTAISKYYKAFDNIEGQGRDEEEGVLPDYIKEGLYVRLPFNDKNGNSLYLNMSYIVPWGVFSSAGEGILPKSALPSDIASTFLIAATTGVNPFDNRPIFLETDDPDEKVIKLGNFIYQTLMPSLAPEIPLTGIKGGYSYEKLMDAIFQRPDRNGTLREVLPTFLDVGFGIKAQPIDPTQEAGKRSYEYNQRLREIQGNIDRISRDQSYTNEEEREKDIQREIRKLEKEGVRFSERFGPQF